MEAGEQAAESSKAGKKKEKKRRQQERARAAKAAAEAAAHTSQPEPEAMPGWLQQPTSEPHPAAAPAAAAAAKKKKRNRKKKGKGAGDAVDLAATGVIELGNPPELPVAGPEQPEPELSKLPEPEPEPELVPEPEQEPEPLLEPEPVDDPVAEVLAGLGLLEHLPACRLHEMDLGARPPDQWFLMWSLHPLSAPPPPRPTTWARD
jgi:hypothetical protein